jgi:uncharacterized protein (DUF58 family)
MGDHGRRYLLEGERAGMRYALGLPRQAPLGLVGISTGSRAGSSLEFKDYREYQPGDDLRHIDWSAYARSDQLHVKMFREEVTPHLDVILDVSRSMALEGSLKAEAALALAGFFVAAAGNAGFSHCAWLLGDQCRPLPNGASLPATWDEIVFEHRGNPAEAFGRDPPAWRARGIRVLLSDLLWVGDPLAVLNHLVDRAAGVVVVQILANADVHPPVGGSLRLVDSETDEIKDLYIDAVAANRYRATLTRHQENWRRACRQGGAIMTTLVAEDVLRDWNLEELVAAEVLKVV